MANWNNNYNQQSLIDSLNKIKFQNGTFVLLHFCQARFKLGL